MYSGIEARIRYLRNNMHNLIEQKDNLLDPEIIRISQQLDILLNKYNLRK